MKPLLDAFVALLDAIPAARDVEIRRYSGRGSTEIRFATRTDTDTIALAKALQCGDVKLVEYGNSQWLEAEGYTHGHMVMVSGPHHKATPHPEYTNEAADAVAKARQAIPVLRDVEVPA